MANIGDVAVCTQIDSTTHDCVASVWMPPPSPIPPMTVAEGNLMGAAFALVWGTCWTLAKARSVLRIA